MDQLGDILDVSAGKQKYSVLFKTHFDLDVVRS